MKKKNLIIGIIKDYDFFTIKPFLVTLRQTGFDGDLVLFVSGINAETKSALDSYHVLSIPFSPQFPYLDTGKEITAHITKQFADSNVKQMIIHVYRFIIWHLYLAGKQLDYDKIMLTDVRDVFFQKEPFDFPFTGNICCFVEDESIPIKDCCYNSAWIKNVYGEEALREIGHTPPSCCGITVGTVPAIRHYLATIVGQLAKIKVYQYGDDTAIHNYLVYKGKFDGLQLYKNEAGPVIALMNKKRETVMFDKRGHVINQNNQIVNMVHQYDRYPEVVEKMFSKNRELAADSKKDRRIFFTG